MLLLIYRYPKKRKYLLTINGNYYSLTILVNNILEDVLTLKEKKKIINWLLSLTNEDKLQLNERPKLTLDCKLVPLLPK